MATDPMHPQRFFKAEASRYALYGVLIAGVSVVLATLLVSYLLQGTVNADGIMLAHQTNAALWVLDVLPFLFGLWGQYASRRMAADASLFVTRRTRQLHLALQRAQDQDRSKTDFFSKVSHELRTPINGVLGMVDMLLETALTDEQRRYAGVVRASADHLLNLINDILDYSKIEAGRLQLEEIEFDPRECIEDSIALLGAQARAKGLRLSTLVQTEVGQRLLGDPGRVRQVILNLVGNAIKFTERGDVSVKATVVQDAPTRTEVRVEVTDTGIGIPPEVMGRLFQPYQQANAATARTFGGTGLGLAISKELVEAMRGRIGVLSAPGGGSTFWFTMSLDKAPSLPVTPPATTELARLRVLLADANVATRVPLAAHLQTLGLHVTQTENGKHALHTLQQAAAGGQVYDLLITDMFLPDLSGEEVGMAVKADARMQQTVMVLITAAGQRGDAQRVNQLGFAAYLAKPVAAEGLRELLVAVMATKTLDEAQRRRRGLITKYTLQAQRKKALRVLLVEDSAVNSEVLRHALSKLGCHTDLAADGEAALAASERAVYDLILMDLHMPKMDGFDAIAALRKQGARAAQVPIIALTAGVSEEERARCLRLGANALLLKPVRVNDLAACIARVRREAAPHVIADEGVPAVPAPSLAQLFIAEADGRLDALRAALETGDLVRAAREAHTLKSTSRHFDTPLSGVAAAVENAANARDTAQATTLLERYTQGYLGLRARLLAAQEPGARVATG